MNIEPNSKFADTIEAMDFIHSLTHIPIWIIRRVMWRNDVYLWKIGVFDKSDKPKLGWWYYPKK